MLSPGTILQNRYHIRHRLDGGGQGFIYRAWDQRLQIEVAIKELAPQTDFNVENWQQLRNQFREEAIILARLHHPNLVKVSDHFDSGGSSYLVMALIVGENLETRIEHAGAIPPVLATDWLGQLLSALAHCHEQGVIHRDIKPANIIIQLDNKPILVDFGLVKRLNPNNPVTQKIVKDMGSVHYAPPEQYGAQSGHTDVRSDIYSLGATFYHALMGDAPPTATERIVNPQQLRPLETAVSKDAIHLAAIITQAMSLQPNERFQTASAMAAALQQRPPQTPARRRFPAWVWVILAVILFGGIGGTAWAMMNRDVPNDPVSTTPVTIATFAPDNPSPSKGDEEEVVADLVLLEAEWTSTPMATRIPTETPFPTETATKMPTLTPTAPPDPDAAQGRIVFVSDRVGNDSIYILDATNQRDPQQLTTAIGYDWWPEWCGANHIVFERSDDLLASTWQEIMYMDISSSNIVQLTSNNMPLGSVQNGSPSCTPSGDTLAFSSRAEGTRSNDFKIGLISLDDAASRFVQFGDGYSLGGNVSWSPQQDAITFMHRESSGFFEIYRASLAAPTNFVNLTDNFGGNGKYPVWSPTANQIAFACSVTDGDSQSWGLCLTSADRAAVDVVLRGLHPGSEAKQKGDWPRHAVTPSWSPNGRWIAFSSDMDGDWDIYIYSLDTGQTINLTSTWLSDEMHPSWGP